MLIDRNIPASRNRITQICSEVSQQKLLRVVWSPASCSFHTIGYSSNAYSLQIQQETGLSRRRPISHGQNLSHRYTRLENALRGKAGYLAEMNDLTMGGGIEPMTVAGSSKDRKVTQRTFMGLNIPEKPTPPADDGMYSIRFYMVTQKN